MYAWRKLTKKQREELLEFRIHNHRPWHRPPHVFNDGQFHLTGACFEHRPHIGLNLTRMADFSRELLETLGENTDQLLAWCVLPNHYHLLVATNDLKRIKQVLGRLHGRISREWNLEENTTGRKVWYRCSDRAMRGPRHHWATINYIHNNPVHHSYVQRWTDWPFSSAREFVDELGREKAAAVWREYPVLDYGKGWDDPEL